MQEYWRDISVSKTNAAVSDLAGGWCRTLNRLNVRELIDAENSWPVMRDYSVSVISQVDEDLRSAWWLGVGPTSAQCSRLAEVLLLLDSTKGHLSGNGTPTAEVAGSATSAVFQNEFLISPSFAAVCEGSSIVLRCLVEDLDDMKNAKGSCPSSRRSLQLGLESLATAQEILDAI